MTFEELLSIDELVNAKVYVAKSNQRIENLYVADDRDFAERVSRGEFVLLSDTVYAGMTDRWMNWLQRLRVIMQRVSC